jgi:dolichol-phosphate mannosyltransferase
MNSPHRADFRIIIPAKNEELRIREPIEKMCRYFGDRARILVVANGCTDNTAALVREMCATHENLELLEIPERIGKGGAVRAGMRIGDEPFLGFVDADGSFNPDQIERLYARCREPGVSGAIGSRRIKGARVGQRPTIARQVASFCFRLLVRTLFFASYSDMQCGVKVFRRDAVDGVLDELELANFAFDVDLLLALRRKKCKLVEEPVTWDDVPAGTIDLLPAAGSMLWSVLRLRLRRGVFRYLPFTDLLASSSVIPVRHGFNVLVVCAPGEPSNNTGAGEIIAQALRRNGHAAMIVRSKSIATDIVALFRYVFFQHTKVDAIVACGEPRLARVLTKSYKPQFVAGVGEGEERITVLRTNDATNTATVDALGNLAAVIARRRGYPGIFRKVAGQWTLSASGESRPSNDASHT